MMITEVLNKGTASLKDAFTVQNTQSSNDGNTTSVQNQVAAVAQELPATAVQTEQIVCSQLQDFFKDNSYQIINNVSTALIAKITDDKLEPHLQNFFKILNNKITDDKSDLNKGINEQIILSLKTAIDKQIEKSLKEQLGSHLGGSIRKKFRKAKTIKKLQKKIKTIRKSKKQYSQ